MRRVVFAQGLWLLLLITTAVPALAQRTTGEIIGTVTDESNAILPGVTVTIRGAGVAGAPTVVTSEVGHLPVSGAAAGRLQPSSTPCRASARSGARVSRSASVRSSS